MSMKINLSTTYIPRKPLILEKYVPDIDSVEINPNKLISSTNGMFKGFGIVKGYFQEADSVNENNRVYPASVLERKIREFAEVSVRNKNAIGELDHPKTNEFSPDLKSGAMAISEVYYDPNTKLVSGEYTILPTSAGRDLLAYHIAGVNIGVSARGLGSLVPDYSGIYENISNGNVVEVVQDDYMLSTYDVVSRPSHTVASNMEVKLTESLNIYKLINEGNISVAYSKDPEIAESWERYWDNLQNMLEFIHKNGIE